MNLQEFMESAERNAWIKSNDLRVYVRKSVRSHDGMTFKMIDIANVSNPRRAMNAGFRSKHHRTGRFRELLDLANNLAMSHNFDAIYVENVLNEFLPDVLTRYGYSRTNGNSFIKSVSQ